MMKKRAFQVIFGVVISALFLYLAVRKIEFNQVWQAVTKTNLWFILAAWSVFASNYFLRTWRWRYILKPVGHFKYWSLYSVFAIGWMANALLPARAGEFIRAYALGKKENISKSLSFATIVVERVFDGLALLSFLLITMLIFPFPDWAQKTVWLVALIFIGSLFLLFLFVFKPSFIRRIAEKILFALKSKARERLLEIIDSFIKGLKILKGPKTIIMLFIVSLMVWTLEGSVYYLGIKSLGLPLGFTAAIMMLVFINVGLIIPSSPGFIGTYEFFGMTSLVLLGISEANALSTTIILHTLTFLHVTILGLIFFWKENIKSASAIRRSKQ